MKKNLKRTIALVLTSLMLIGTAACGASTTTAKAEETTKAAAGETTKAAAGETTTAAAATGDLVKVAFICADMSNPSQAYSSKQFTQFGKDYGFDVTILDAKGDAQTESQLVTNAIAQGMKAVFLNPNDINAIIPSIKQAKEAGLIVGMYSSDLPAEAAEFRDFFVGVNDTQAGEAAAQAFITKFPDGAKIVEVGGQAGHDAQIKRHDGFNKGIEGSKIEVIDYQTPQQWDTTQAMTIMEDMITKNGDDIKGVFCHWDNGATGVIQALTAANMMEDMFIVAVDGNLAGYQQVQDGLQGATISQNFQNMTKKSLENAQAVLAGKTVEPINFIPLDIITIDNLTDFPTPEW